LHAIKRGWGERTGTRSKHRGKATAGGKKAHRAQQKKTRPRRVARNGRKVGDSYKRGW